MITLKRLNVVRKVATEEQAAKLERLGFARTGGTAEAPVGAGVTEADLAKMGEAMFERLSDNLKEAVAKATAQPPKPTSRNAKSSLPGVNRQAATVPAAAIAHITESTTALFAYE